MARPKGSKSKSHDGYDRRTGEIRKKYGAEIFRKWGRKGGNPNLVSGSR